MNILPARIGRLGVAARYVERQYFIQEKKIKNFKNISKKGISRGQPSIKKYPEIKKRKGKPKHYIQIITNNLPSSQSIFM